MTPTRPAIRWMGGKWKLAPWIIGNFPTHQTYVEPYGGGASVLLRKARCYGEVYNDLDVAVVNLFRVLRDPESAKRLIELLGLTPFARDEFYASYEETSDPVEWARRFVVRSYQGYGSNACTRPSTGFRSKAVRQRVSPAVDWRALPAKLHAVVDRLRGVVIENRDAKAVMEQYDRPEALHYVDPPYVHETRRQGNPYSIGYDGYAHELSDDDHRELLAFLKTLQGVVVLSGYSHPIYDDALQGWVCIKKETHADGARKRTEVLWINRIDPAPLLAAGGIDV